MPHQWRQLYQSMDWLAIRQGEIEHPLFNHRYRHKTQPPLHITSIITHFPFTLPRPSLMFPPHYLNHHSYSLQTTSTITHIPSTIPQPSLTSTIPRPSFTVFPPHYLNHHSQIGIRRWHIASVRTRTVITIELVGHVTGRQIRL